MEKFRIVYYDKDGEASEALVEAEDGIRAAESIENMGRLKTITSMGPAAPSYGEEHPDREVNEGDAGHLGLEDMPEELPYKDGEDS